IKVKPDNSWIVTEGVNYRANPFDEIAVEEALRVRDANAPSEVVAVSIGGAAAQAEVRSALAMGADRGILVKHDGFLDSDAVARLLQKVIDKEKPDLVLMGKQAVDVDDNVTGQLLAEYLGWGQATFASKKESLESPAEKAKKPGLELGADKKSLQGAGERDQEEADVARGARGRARVASQPADARAAPPPRRPRRGAGGRPRRRDRRRERGRGARRGGRRRPAAPRSPEEALVAVHRRR